MGARRSEPARGLLSLNWSGLKWTLTRTSAPWAHPGERSQTPSFVRMHTRSSGKCTLALPATSLGRVRLRVRQGLQSTGTRARSSWNQFWTSSIRVGDMASRIRFL